MSIGIGLRLSMLWTYDPHLGYDWYDHLVYIDWFKEHWALPPLMLSRETYHPPLYYLIAGLFGRLQDGRVATYGFPPIVFGSATLILLWVGLERHVKNSRCARIIALALAAVLAAGVHLSGMMYGEALNGLLALTALLLAAELLRRQKFVRPLGWLPVALGFVLGLQMLTKISALVILGSILTAAGVDFLLRGDPIRERLRRAKPWLVVLAVFVATCGWYFARNQVLYGKSVLTAFDGRDGLFAAHIEGTPYLDHRPGRFFYGWTGDVFVSPFYPSDAGVPASYFWPVLVASTFVDYYNYNYVQPPRPGQPSQVVNGRPLRRQSLPVTQASMAGGTLIAASTAIAWLWAIIVVLRRLDVVRLAFLVAPALAVVGQLHFAVRYPLDYQGPIKGIYVQFAAPALFALFGLSVRELAKRFWTRPLAVLQGVALVLVAAYTVYARVIAF